jgi:ribosomal protein L37AE/L43A
MELLSGVFTCDCCKKPVVARDFEQIVEWNKLCADCRVKDVTGGFKEKVKSFKTKKKPVKEYTGPLRREDPKKRKKKPLSQSQKEAIRIADDAKWDRIRYGYQNAYYEKHNIQNNED